ncbi:MAG TPA: glycosyltransferase family 87 protein [Tepidisphaeraceae bacterium]|nr:glycosyltransferase family 87 protein [Tepidisphaeraceae bacterium]
MYVPKLLDRRRVRRVSIAVLLTSALLLIVAVLTAKNNRTIFGPNLGGDWLAFHDAGRILNEYGPNRLYDVGLQAELYHNTLPDEPPEANLPFANAPFVAVMAAPLAKLPYIASYLAWVMISLAIFVAALMLALRAADMPRSRWTFCLIVGLSFEPLMFECIHGGQISAIGLFALTAAAFLNLSNRPLSAGLALAVCIYKPTLLPIVLIMLAACRQWRVLGGFMIGSLLLGIFCLLAVGLEATFDYLRILASYAGLCPGPISNGIFVTWKFIDLNSFLKLLGTDRIWIALVMLAAAIEVTRGARLLWNTPVAPGTDDLRMAWACALSCTLVLNVYVGIYDSVLILPSLFITTAVVLRRAEEVPSMLRLLMACAFVLPWCSQIMAREMGFQPFTLALLAIGAMQFQLLSIGNKSYNIKVFPVFSTMSRV